MSGELLFALELGISGLLVGVMYALVALGFVLIYKASAVFNFAQGAMTLFAALALVGFIPYVGLAGALLAVIVLMALLALGIERIILRPLVARPPLSLFMATIGLGFFLEGFSQALWGTQPKGLDIGIPDTSFVVRGVLGISIFMEANSTNEPHVLSPFSLFVIVVPGGAVQPAAARSTLLVEPLVGYVVAQTFLKTSVAAEQSAAF